MLFRDKKIKILSVIFALTLMMAVFAGCGDDEPISPDDDADVVVIGDIKVSISIDFPGTAGLTDVEDVKMGLPSESSVLDLLFAYANENNIDVEIEGGDDNPFVVSIAGVFGSGNSEWTYVVNDETVMESAGNAMLKDGDEVIWEFTKI